MSRAWQRLSCFSAFSQLLLSARPHTRRMQHQAQSDQPPAPSSDPIRALVVEDDTGTAEFVRVDLAYEGFDVAVCADGAAAVRMADRMRPDVVVLTGCC